MKRGAASGTAAGVGLARALEQARPAGDRLLDDPFAVALARHTPAGRLLFGSRPAARISAALLGLAMPGTVEFVAARGRYSDELAGREARACALQLVILGAGFDTAALRLGRLGEQLEVFEVDHPATQAAKREAIARVAPGADARVRYVAVDFERDDVFERLLRARFDPGRRSTVTWMGVTYYLTATAVDAALARLARLMAPGSALAFDYVLPSVVDGTAPGRTVRLGTRRAARLGEPFLFGLRPLAVAPLLARHGFALEEQATPAEVLRSYSPSPRPSIDFAMLVTARRR
jgi:methyltransferase (TIGR00027 family)